MTDRPLIPIMRPWMDEREAAAAARPILSGWITQGPEVAAFEREFAAAVGAAHACAVGNCTAALHLALLACGVEPGTANATRLERASPSRASTMVLPWTSFMDAPRSRVTQWYPHLDQPASTMAGGHQWRPSGS